MLETSAYNEITICLSHSFGMNSVYVGASLGCDVPKKSATSQKVADLKEKSASSTFPRQLLRNTVARIYPASRMNQDGP